jgi:hypothetical protein
MKQTSTPVMTNDTLHWTILHFCTYQQHNVTEGDSYSKMKMNPIKGAAWLRPERHVHYMNALSASWKTPVIT